MLSKYINIIQTRFQDHLKIKQSIDFEALQVPIPPLILQPIFENAIKHGLPEEKALIIHMRINIESNNRLNIHIRNNGLPLGEPVDFSVGGGMGIINDRLQALYNGDYEFNIENTSPDEVRVSLNLPVEVEEKG